MGNEINTRTARCEKMILQKVYHKLQEWIIMLDSPDFKDTDTELVREEMIQFAGEIWVSRDLEPKQKYEVDKDYIPDTEPSVQEIEEGFTKNKQEDGE